MTTALIIIGIVAGTFMAFRFSNKIAVKRLNQENKEICDAHQQIEYPELKKMYNSELWKQEITALFLT